VAGSFERGNEASASLKIREIIDQLNDYQLLKNALLCTINVQ
jgi:hypothetical protein